MIQATDNLSSQVFPSAYKFFPKFMFNVRVINFHYYNCKLIPAYLKQL
jgi:hypothetical protein